MASAIVIIGSKSREIRATKRCTLKNIITVKNRLKHLTVLYAKESFDSQNMDEEQKLIKMFNLQKEIKLREIKITESNTHVLEVNKLISDLTDKRTKLLVEKDNLQIQIGVFKKMLENIQKVKLSSLTTEPTNDKLLTTVQVLLSGIYELYSPNRNENFDKLANIFLKNPLFRAENPELFEQFCECAFRDSLWTNKNNYYATFIKEKILK